MIKVQKDSKDLLIWHFLEQKLKSKWDTYINPRFGQYLTHAHSHMTREVAAK